ncbi:MAG: GNAT family N-acetyltransferase [Jatrophihabitantaceae bacterium]
MSGAGVRRVRESDLAAVAGLVRELAEYERAPLQCQLTRSQLRRALFGAEPTLFGHVVEVRGDVVGCALWLLDSFSGEGCEGIFLKDLYVRPDHRGRGLGRGLLAALAAESCQRGFARLEWSVAEWNMPAIGFYRSLGAPPRGGRAASGMDGQALVRLAAATGALSRTGPR